MYTGPKSKRDGLVFGYDTGEYSSSNPNKGKHTPQGKKGRGSHRFYKGRPTTNYVSYQNAVPQSSYTAYTPTTDSTWLANHPDAIQAYNAQGNSITGYVNTGVNSGNWQSTHHAHWQLDKQLKKPVVVMNCFDSHWKAKSFNCNTNAWSTYGMTAGSKYVISWLQWTTHTNKYLSVGVYAKNSSNVRNFYDGRSSASDSTVFNTKARTWQRVYKVYTVSSAHDITIDYHHIYMYGHYGTNGAGVTIKIADVQLELDTDYPSAFLDSRSGGSTTSRSSTESLKDLTKKYTIDTSNMSFNSSGFPTFDGTNDYLDLGSDIVISPDNQGWTAEYVFNTDSASTLQHFNSAENDEFNANWLAIYNSKLAVWNRSPGYWRYGDTIIQSNTWYHAVFVCDAGGTNYRYYINGEREGGDHVNNVWNATYSSLETRYIGRYEYAGSYSRYFNGEIPVTKMYDRALSDKEIKQNFSAYRKRFNI